MEKHDNENLKTNPIESDQDTISEENLNSNVDKKKMKI